MRRSLTVLTGSIAVAALLLAGCSSNDEEDLVPTSRGTEQAETMEPEEGSDASPSASADESGGVSGATVKPSAAGDITTGLAAPWSVAFLPDGSALVSQRDTGGIVHLSESGGKWRSREVGGVVGIDNSGEGGLMGLAVQPGGSADDARVYAMWTSGSDNRVGVFDYDGNTLSTRPKVILDGIPKSSIHNGGRLAFGQDGALYVATGDAGDPELAQNPDSLAGKILRVGPDGRPLQDNPTPGSLVYSLGHRNIQGLAFDDEGRLWASEFGSKDVDELNLIEPGGNYGWPQVEGASDNSDFINPAAQWTPTSVASPSGLAIADGNAWVATLRGQTLYQVPLDGEQASKPLARFAEDYGRLRDVVAAPDGSLWLVTNNTDGRGDPRPGDDRIVRVELTG